MFLLGLSRAHRARGGITMTRPDHQDDTARRDGFHPLALGAAIALAIPVGGLLWFELSYLAFGITGNPGSALGSAFAAVAGIGLAFAWAMIGTGEPADVVRRACRLGIVAALLLPVVAMVVLLIWRNIPARPDPGAGGLLLNSAPLIGAAVGLALAVAFWLGQAAAARRLRSQREGEAD